MKELVFFLEEPSAAEMLAGILPRLLSDNVIPRFITFEGKQDLERQLIRRLRGYQNPGAVFVVMRDQDSQPDCRVIKTRLASMCQEAGRPDALARIACRELESFYLADLSAVERGLGLSNVAKHQHGAKFRNPDQTVSPAVELAKLSRGQYQKVSGSRAISPYLDLENTRSPSFHNLIKGIRRIVAS
jgi:hypothetical protein